MMGVSTVWKLDKFVLPSSVEFGNFTSQNTTAGIQSLIERPAGHVSPMFVGTLMQRPEVQFATPQLRTLLAVCGVGGLAITASSTLYYKKATQTSNVARATTQHRKLVATQGLLHWARITLGIDKPGSADVTFCAGYDGTNAPLVYTGSVALSGTLSSEEYFVAGPVEINGTAMPGVQEITIESGIQLSRQAADGDSFDTFLGVETVEPKVTIKFIEAVNWATVLAAGVELDGSSGLLGYARKIAYAGARVANDGGEHIAFQAINGRVIPQDTQGQGSTPVSDTVMVECVALTDGVYPLVFSVDQDIS